MTRVADGGWQVPARPALLIAIGLTTLAELVYLIVWGLILFPAGDPIGKIVWTLTCGIAMGSVIGAVMVVLTLRKRRLAALAAFLAVAVIGSACAVLCSRIDARFGYFGGAENANLFVLAGVLPAIVGGVLCAWLLTSRAATALRLRAGRVS